jgi:hypothetical protein
MRLTEIPLDVILGSTYFLDLHDSVHLLVVSPFTMERDTSSHGLDPTYDRLAHPLKHYFL